MYVWYSSARRPKSVFTLSDMQSLLNARPFVPFRLWLSDGGYVDVRSRELVLPGRRFALIALLDPDADDGAFDRYTTVWYFHVARQEMLAPGAPPFTTPTGESGAPTSTPG
jgi:hypothetical protein